MNSEKDIPEADFEEEPRIYFADSLIAAYSVFRDQVYNPVSVLHPSCGFDASPARVFNKVTFVDAEEGNEGCIKQLQEAGFNALKQDIRDYSPETLHDLLILLNPAIPTEWASRHLKTGGYVLSNNYHGNASEMHNSPEFTLWGVIEDEKEPAISRELEDLFQPVKGAEDFRRLRQEDFEFTRDTVLHFAEQGIIKVDPDADFEQKWAVYREELREGMPYKRVADFYIFLK